MAETIENRWPIRIRSRCLSKPRQDQLRNDPWNHRLIGQPDFSGRIVSRQTAAERFGTYSADAHVNTRLQRIRRHGLLRARSNEWDPEYGVIAY